MSRKNYQHPAQSHKKFFSLVEAMKRLLCCDSSTCDELVYPGAASQTSSFENENPHLESSSIGPKANIECNYQALSFHLVSMIERCNRSKNVDALTFLTNHGHMQKIDSLPYPGQQDRIQFQRRFYPRVGIVLSPCRPYMICLRPLENVVLNQRKSKQSAYFDSQYSTVYFTALERNHVTCKAAPFCVVTSS